MKTLALMLVASLLFSGCGTTQYEALRKKFIREKKKKAEPTRFLTEPVKRANAELYREHYTYFGTWHTTLLEYLGKNRKRETQAAREAERHLMSLPKLIEDEYANELVKHVDDYRKLTAEIKDRPLSLVRNSTIAGELDRVALRVQRSFAVKDMEPHLRADEAPMDLAAYEDDLSGVLAEPLPEETNGEIAHPEPEPVS